ncbi:MAG: hypothetical protein GC203_03545 [Phenylobacterium sp.]|uniref:sensor histidine kinase n=1 Tax=Phenylobacterium sp. TaxID=1871053 RepID=UPI0025FAD7D0|nr:ATP-binding protein [Phenylobacterium sp.]MBI1196913.1 hypothetical protein [Phenylobacterium sp.]
MASGGFAAAAGNLERVLTVRLTPVRLLTVALLVALGVAGGAIGFSISQPWLGLDLRFDARAGGAVVEASAGPSAAIPAGTVLVAAHGAGARLRLERNDLTGQVDGSFGPFADFRRFMTRQGLYAQMQRAPEMTFTDAQGRDWTIRPDRSGRPISTLGPDFWIGVLVGVFSWLMSAAIFVFRPREASARYVLLSGAAMLFCSPMGVMYSARELGLPTTAFYLINGCNFLGGSLFAAAVLALLLYYPRRIAPRWAGGAIIGVFLAWYVAQAAGLFPDLTFARRFLVMCALAASLGLAAVHWRTTRRDPLGRAALGWFLVSWVVVVSTFAGLVLAPQMFGVDTSAIEPYGFLLFPVIYLGLAVGIMRYRLFELGEWWVRIMTWALGLMLLAALDLALLAGLQLSAGASLSLALLVCGLVWLPLRTWLAERILRRRKTDPRALFEGVVQIGLTASPAEQLARWTQVLNASFDPLRIDICDGWGAAQPRLEADGLALVAPAVKGLPALRLEYARGGRALFTPADLAQAASLAGMLDFVFDSRDAYERGVKVERRRIAGDIHDNLGASLLSALHSRDGERKDRFIRETLADLRSIVTEPANGETGLVLALAGARKEMAERLEARGMTLDWRPDPALDADVSRQADSRLLQSLRAMLREITNNILKHALAQTAKVEMAERRGELVLAVEDDGIGFDPAAVAQGAGLSGLSERAERHGGAVSWTSGAGGRGARVEIRLPLGAAP